MKKFITLVLLTLAVTTASAQQPKVIPGKGHLVVENLRKVDTNMDISQLSMSELRVLRNSFAAKQGYIFMDAELRSLFASTTWYNDKMWDRFNRQEEELGYDKDGNLLDFPLKYTPQEQAFVKKLLQREKELQETYFNTGSPDFIVNTSDIINNYQLEEIDPKLDNALARYGFAIVPDDKDQLFHIYEKNDYDDFPSFVTTDLFLQMFHFYFDCVLRDIEETHFVSVVEKLALNLYNQMGERIANATSKEEKAAAEYNQTFAAVALALITNEPLKPLPASYADMGAEEVQNATVTENNISEFLGYTKIKFPYSLFRPRGHYTRSEACQRYFRAMMWMQTAPFGTDKPQQLNAAILLAEAVAGDPAALRLYNTIFEPITFFMGEPDNITILQVWDIMQKHNATASSLLKNKKELKKVKKDIEDLAQQQTRIRPKFEKSSPYKINLMPQRYQPDAEVLNELIDAKNEISKRAYPMGLDVFAATGSTKAQQVLTDELQQDKQWEDYLPTLNKMKKRMGEIEWNATVATRWIDALTTLTTAKDQRMPYFMATPQWGKKDLNTALASWAELKHDAILYAKQPMAAECGDGGPPAAIVKGYVEPNVAFWSKAIDLVNATERIINKYNLDTQKVGSTTGNIKELGEELLDISNKELNGEPLTEIDYGNISVIGSTIEWITLDLLRDEDQSLMGWDDVNGPDKQMAVIADVYTANGDNNPEKGILYEGVGPAYQIYVVVPVGKYLYLMRGGVFSYREFTRPIYEQRLTDEEWQEMLKQYPTRGIPSWMDEITVPLKVLPKDDEVVFYSSGC